MKIGATSLKALGALCIAGMLTLASCKEKGPAINFADDAFVDTTFTAGVETAQPRRILAEEATGVKCSNCPAGVIVMESIESQYPGRVIPVGIHGGNLTDPFPISHQNFRNADADELMNTYFAEGPDKPSACLDRIQTSGKYFIGRSLWPATATTRIGQPQLVNVTVASDYTDATNQAVIKIHVAFTQPVSKKLSLSLYFLEDAIIDPQEDGLLIDTNYVHNHVLRDIVTPVSGMPFLDEMATKGAGRVYEVSMIYKPNSAWKPANCRLVAFVHTNEPGDKEVLQVAETNLK